MKVKSLCLVVVILSIVLLSGCGIGTELTEDENSMIAEYAAELLLKYDANYQQRLSKDEFVSTEAVEESTTEAYTEENVTTEEIISTQEEEGSSIQQTTEEESTDIQTSTEDTGIVQDNVNIAAFLGIKDISITYDRHLFLDKYPSLDSDGAFIYLEASEGMKLIVVKFNICNSTANDVKVDLLNTDVNYQIIMNDSKAAKPMLTILMDDLGTFNTVVSSGSEQSAVLVFQISEDLIDEIKSLKLRVTYDSQETTLIL